MRHRIKQKADPAQETAIRHGAGPCAVIAGPGSGKTFVLTQRIRYLIQERGTDPSSILVLTFSRAAAAHMRRRFLLSCAHPETVFGTFHSVFFRILQEASGGTLRLVQPAEKERYLRHLCGLGLPFLPEKTTPEEVQLLISRFKNGLPCRETWAGEVVRVYDDYMEGRGLLDFDDMILRCEKLLRERPQILEKWRTRFQWILVDEFQDVSPSQYEVLALLAAPADNLFIVGDDDQSIYGFRGADPRMMQRFLADYVNDREDAGERTVFLTSNYRCGKRILEAGASLIRCNKNRIDKDFRAGTDEEGSFVCRPFTDRTLEYSYIAQELAQMRPGEQERTAVIFRTHGAAGQFLRVLREHGIAVPAAGTGKGKEPIIITDKTRILQDLTAYYRAAVSLEGGGRQIPAAGGGRIFREDLLRLMNRPERFLSGSFIPFDYSSREELLEHAGYESAAVRELMDDLGLLNTLSPSYSMRYLCDSVGYRSYALEAYKEAGPVLNELCGEASGYSNTRQWLYVLEKMREASMRPQTPEKNAETGAIRTQEEPPTSGQNAETGTIRPQAEAHTVSILTMHACKGLEFDTVFIPDLNEGSVPSKRSWTPDQVEEERRLLYVAMTRARRSLILTYLEGTADRPAAPSRFLLPFAPQS